MGSPAMDVAGLWAGHKAAKAAKKMAKKEYKDQKGYTKKQTDIADYIQQLAKQAATTNSDIYDPSGGFTRFNPATGKYEYGLGSAQQGIQNASYDEELLRNTRDQQLRRAGLQDFERQRQIASGRGDRALADIDAQRRGIGMVDPAAVAGQLQADRTRQLNAGYDDAERAARTMQLRTGSSAVGDALSTLARDRVRAQAGMGSPSLEGLEFAQQMNMPRTEQAYGVYGNMADRGQQFYDAQFDPSQYEAMGRENLGKQMEFDMSKLDLGMGGGVKAAGAINNAALGQQSAYTGTNKLATSSPFAKLMEGGSSLIDSYAKKYGTMGMG